MNSKFKIGDIVRCTKHGTVFVIKSINHTQDFSGGEYANGIIYYDRETFHKVCKKDRVSYGGSWGGVPEDTAEKVDKFVSLDF